MDALELYNQQFISCLGVSQEDLGENLVYQSVDQWDSVGHMQLMAALEAAFDVFLDMEDIIDFSSYERGKEILKKYGVEVQ